MTTTLTTPPNTAISAARDVASAPAPGDALSVPIPMPLDADWTVRLVWALYEHDRRTELRRRQEAGELSANVPVSSFEVIK